MNAASGYCMAFIWRTCLVAALGGLLFGYDWVVTGGAKPFFEQFFGLESEAMLGWAMSSALVGCLFGAGLSGLLSDRYGRKRLLILAPVTWVLLSELFPNRIRGAAMSISVFSLWLSCWALAQWFPSLNARLGPHGSFWLFGIICLAGFLFILRVLPETRGKTLEDIERELVN